ncbi:MAG TPA: hypothetical protein VHX36_01200, partial [Candidatus Acidoferrales bacterium]|nr:hypothetical protein [Candidatus Acidoferrales bacterium]
VSNGHFNLPQQRHDLLRLVTSHGHDRSSLQVNSLSFHLVQKSPVRSGWHRPSPSNLDPELALVDLFYVACAIKSTSDFPSIYSFLRRQRHD